MSTAREVIDAYNNLQWQDRRKVCEELCARHHKELCDEIKELNHCECWEKFKKWMKKDDS